MKLRQLAAWTTFVAAIGASGGALADHRDFDASGSGLALANACARQVTVTIDPALSGRVAVTADAVNPQELDQLAAGTVDGQARVGLRPDRDECWTPQRDGDFDRTLALAVRIPGRFPVSVSEGGLGDYALGAVGPLALHLSGMVTLLADTVTGDLHVAASGRSRVEIGRVDAGRLVATLSGADSLVVRDGRIGALDVSESGVGRVRIEPVVDSARLSVSGAGSIVLGGVRGTLSDDISGIATITVAGKMLTGSGTATDQ